MSLLYFSKVTHTGRWKYINGSVHLFFELLLLGVFAYSQFKLREQAATTAAAGLETQNELKLSDKKQNINVNIHDPSQSSYKGPLVEIEGVSMRPLPPKN